VTIAVAGTLRVPADNLHKAARRAAWPRLGVSDQKLFAYDVAEQRPL
jgi:hypothetical protein